MAHFETDAEVYDQLGGILTNLVGNTSRLEQLRQADAVVQFAFRSPDAKVTLDVRAGKAPRVELGDSRMRPDVVLAMDAEVGHALLHGELSPTVALARGDVRLKGNVAKVLRVVPVTVGAHEVEADQPVEATVAGQEPEPVEAAAEGQPEAGEAQAEAGQAQPEGGAAQPEGGEAAGGEQPAEGEEQASSQTATGYEIAESPAVGEPGEPASEEASSSEAPAADDASASPEGGADAEAVIATAEAADAAGGEEPPAASEDQQA
jgi:putative sterol carrier protein